MSILARLLAYTVPDRALHLELSGEELANSIRWSVRHLRTTERVTRSEELLKRAGLGEPSTVKFHIGDGIA